MQHHYKWLYQITDHKYHHAFRYPTAQCGPWLSTLDLLLSGFFFVLIPTEVTMFACRLLGIFDGLDDSIPRLLQAVLGSYIHIMNAYAHCGRQVPTWSGAPLCPPLGFALNLHEGIPNHEAHHNFHNCGFGLLGVADKCFGTFNVPRSHPKFDASCKRLKKGWGAHATSVPSKDIHVD